MKKNTVIFALLAFLTLVYPVSAGCISCHSSDQRIYTEIYPAINTSIFGFHRDVNITDGDISDRDCIVCHYNFSNMFDKGFTVATYTCEECHISNIIGIVPADRMVYNHNLTGAQIFLWGLLAAIAITRPQISPDTAPMQALPTMGGTQALDFPRVRLTALTAMRIRSTVYRDVMQNPKNTMLGNHTSGIMNASHPPGAPIAQPATGLTGYMVRTSQSLFRIQDSAIIVIRMTDCKRTCMQGRLNASDVMQKMIPISIIYNICFRTGHIEA